MRFHSYAFAHRAAVVASCLLTLVNGCADRDSSDRNPSESNVGRAPSPTVLKAETSSIPKADSARGLDGRAPISQASDGRSHSAGTRGGTIVPIGADSFHAEVVVDQDGTLRMLMLGRDETRIQEVEIQQLRSYVKAPGAAARAVDLMAVPDAEDTEGRTSQFTGQLPKSFIGKPLEVTIPNVKIQGERFGVGFTTGDQRQINRRRAQKALRSAEER